MYDPTLVCTVHTIQRNTTHVCTENPSLVLLYCTVQRYIYRKEVEIGGVELSLIANLLHFPSHKSSLLLLLRAIIDLGIFT